MVLKQGAPFCIPPIISIRVSGFWGLGFSGLGVRGLGFRVSDPQFWEAPHFAEQFAQFLGSFSFPVAVLGGGFPSVHCP